MRKLDETIARLRLALAEIETKEAALAQLERQASEQYKRVINFALYEGGDLDRSLQMMDEIGQRTQYARTALTHLRMVKSRAQDDLKAMTLTKTIEDAKAELAELQLKLRDGAEVAQAIEALENRIAEASDLAGRLMMERQRSAP